MSWSSSSKMPFPIVHEVKPELHNEVLQGELVHNNFWEFFGLQLESAHMVTWVMPDRGPPRRSA
ncbi:uncharacterized protein ARMOST_08540 [Armillaria ostoyae]|uniref:catalase n=1 Tax=Armillaria ostoyae TaxID=47428 RepID=A0A284R8W0_ARMOS|nr:uncharacterized protein ARMOST_08540 [Armillaria ostoyae]